MLDFLRKALAENDIFADASPDECERCLALLQQHWQLVKNAGFNLTAITEDEEAAVKHYWDCLFIAQKLPENARCLDIGSGAGFPGLVLAAARPDTKWLLLDSLNKRCEFLKRAAREMGLKNVEVMHARAEEAGQNKKFRESFDIVAARAVTAMPVLAELTLPFLKKGGLLLAMKGPALAEELAEAQNALKVLQGKVISSQEYCLPVFGDGRTLCTVEKIGSCPAKYPRRAGTPKSDPL